MSDKPETYTSLDLVLYAFRETFAKTEKGNAAHREACEEVARLREYEETYQRVISEQCAPDEVHCTCVPALRARITEVERLAKERNNAITILANNALDSSAALSERNETLWDKVQMLKAKLATARELLESAVEPCMFAAECSEEDESDAQLVDEINEFLEKDKP